MRFEAHLILWVIAGISIGVVIFHGAPETAEVDFPSSAPSVLTVSRASLTLGEADAGSHAILPRELPAIDRQARPLFHVEGGTVETVQNALAPPEPLLLPMLKGIVSSDDGLRAVFATDPENPSYVAVDVGGVLGDYRIVSIGPDRVEATGATGNPITFLLRGVGESP